MPAYPIALAFALLPLLGSCDHATARPAPQDREIRVRGKSQPSKSRPDDRLHELTLRIDGLEESARVERIRLFRLTRQRPRERAKGGAERPASSPRRSVAHSNGPLLVAWTRLLPGERPTTFQIEVDVRTKGRRNTVEYSGTIEAAPGRPSDVNSALLRLETARAAGGKKSGEGKADAEDPEPRRKRDGGEPEATGKTRFVFFTDTSLAPGSANKNLVFGPASNESERLKVTVDADERIVALSAWTTRSKDKPKELVPIHVVPTASGTEYRFDAFNRAQDRLLDDGEKVPLYVAVAVVDEGEEEQIDPITWTLQSNDQKNVEEKSEPSWTFTRRR